MAILVKNPKNFTWVLKCPSREFLLLNSFTTAECCKKILKPATEHHGIYHSYHKHSRFNGYLLLFNQLFICLTTTCDD